MVKNGKMYRHFFKRFFDFIVALILLLLLWPLLLLLLLLLAPELHGRPWFVQERPGKGGQVFRLLKLKTMRELYDSDGRLLPDKERLTAMGRLVRSLSLDELPNLLNVLKGDMSLVGPRPLLVRYLALYNSRQQRRHEVRPGITGWAQVNGRNAITWNEKFELDIYYVDHVRLVLDLKILWRTVLKVLLRESVDRDEQTTMPAFTGK